MPVLMTKHKKIRSMISFRKVPTYLDEYLKFLYSAKLSWKPNENKSSHDLPAISVSGLCRK